MINNLMVCYFQATFLASQLWNLWLFFILYNRKIVLLFLECIIWRDQNSSNTCSIRYVVYTPLLNILDRNRLKNNESNWYLQPQYKAKVRQSHQKVEAQRKFLKGFSDPWESSICPEEFSVNTLQITYALKSAWTSFPLVFPDINQSVWIKQWSWWIISIDLI